MHFVAGLSIKEIARRTGRDRNTVRKALRSSEPPRYRRAPRPSKLDPFREEVHRLLRDDPRLPGKRVRELLAEQGYRGSKTILDDYLREVRPLFAARRAYQRTVYRPAGRPLPVRPLGALAAGAGRPRAAQQGLRRRGLTALLARRHRRARLLEGGA